MSVCHQQFLQRQVPLKVTQKAQLTYKLFLLENARHTLYKELGNFINEAYEEVHNFFNSSIPPGAFSNLSHNLDVKCQAIGKFSAFLKDLELVPQVQPVQENDVKTNFIKPLKKKNVSKFWPMLQNMLMSSSIGRAVQRLGATLHLQHFISPQTLKVQEKEVTCSISPVQTFSEQDASILAETEQISASVECSSKKVTLPPALCDGGKTKAPKLPLLPAIPLATRYTELTQRIPLMKWGYDSDIQVQHQKQTSFQLLHFLKVKAKNAGALNVTTIEWNNGFLGPPQPASPSHSVKTQSHQFTCDTDNVTWPSRLRSDTENHAPPFKLKHVESSGSLTYTCVIRSKTELWDIGEIITGVDHSNSCSVASEEIGQVKASDETVPLTDAALDAAMQAGTASVMMPAVTGIPVPSTIPEFQNRKFQEIEVVVSHIVSPGSFYIQHADTSEKLQTFVTDSWKSNRSYAEQNCIPDIGTTVMGWFPQQEQWCRSQVTKICGVSKDDSGEMSILVEVRRLDYGDSLCLSLSKIKELPSEMAALPLQAVQVSLAHVSPVNGRAWSEEAVGWFRAMVHNRTFFARLYPEGHRVTVELFLEKGKIGAMRRGASLSLRLTQNGHAKHDKLKNGVRGGTVKMKKQNTEWEKYLISCYIQK